MIIITRTLRMKTEGDEIDVAVRIYLPAEEEGCWLCEYEIVWPAGVRKRQAYGIDAVQSLLIALQMIGAEIYTSDAHRSGKLRWEQKGGGYGFPLPAGMRDLHEGDDRSL